MKKINQLLFVATIFFFPPQFSKAQSNNTRINHLAIYVMDLQKSTDFYHDIIGLDTIPEPFHDGKHTWMKIGPGSSLHIIQGATSKKEYYKGNHICFSISSMEKFVETLRKKNIPWEDWANTKMSITTRVDGVKQLWLQDPDGYWIEMNDSKE